MPTDRSEPTGKATASAAVLSTNLFTLPQTGPTHEYPGNRADHRRRYRRCDIVFMSAIGGAFGYLFTVHLVESFASELEAVWITTVLFAVAGVYLGGLRQS